MHGALCAAVAVAGRQLCSDWRKIPLRFLSPVDARPILGVGDECGLFTGAATIVLRPEVSPFWDVARHATATARACKSASGLRAIVGAAGGVVSPGATPQSACAFAANAFGREALISNLGAVPGDLRFDAWKVSALWGPMVLSGFEGDQSIGVASLDGALHLTHSSYTPFPELLAAVERVVSDACRSA